MHLAHLILSAVIAAAEAGHGGGHGGGAASLISPDLALTIATWITFLLLVVLIGKFGWGPFTKALDERESKIADDVARAENARSEAERLLKQYEDQLARAREEADKVLAEGRSRAEATAARLEEEARKASEEMTERARQTIEAERLKAVSELNRIVATAAVDLAGKIIKEELDGKKHQKLIDATVSQMESLKK